MTDTASVARALLATLEARDWEAWEALLTGDVVYEMPQTRERIRGRAAYREFNETYPGEWHLTPKVVIGGPERAVVWFTWTFYRDGSSEAGDAQVFLEFDGDGLITRVTDFWPEPYDPPARPAGLVERW
jgi:ketosteroid isomerase-like protein